jgi:hypothetical protein
MLIISELGFRDWYGMGLRRVRLGRSQPFVDVARGHTRIIESTYVRDTGKEFHRVTILTKLWY